MTLPTPYYESEKAVIYHGDCLDILPHLSGVDAVVTDPPYGHGKKWSGGTWAANPIYEAAFRWDAVPANREAIEMAISMGPSIVWGGNYFSLPPSRCWLSWDKTSRMDTMADFELAWTSLDRPSKRFLENRNPDGTRAHPTQKPLSLMKWCLGFVDGQTVLDPWMGSGTTGVACMKLGRKFIGIEIEPKYCEIAKRRLVEAEGQFDLFEPPKKIEQNLLDLGGA